jgi:hypothetical protein
MGVVGGVGEDITVKPADAPSHMAKEKTMGCLLEKWRYCCRLVGLI